MQTPIQTEKQWILLLDTSKSSFELIQSGGRYDFMVEHDMKEFGPHTYAVSYMYMVKLFS